MNVQRHFFLRVHSKLETPSGNKSVGMEPEDLDIPWWVAKHHDSGLARLTVTDREFDAIAVGDVVSVTITIGGSGA